MPKRVRFEVRAWGHDSDHDLARNNMPETNLNYFICTLGEAARWNRDYPHPFETLHDLVDHQAKELRQRPALNFPGGCNGEDGHEMKSGEYSCLSSSSQ